MTIISPVTRRRLEVQGFDLLYNHGVRHLTGTGPLPRRGAPNRFACGVGAVWLVVTAWAFQSGAIVTGYILGGMLAFVGLLVSTTDICLPSLVYRTMFGFPPRSGHDPLQPNPGRARGSQ